MRSTGEIISQTVKSLLTEAVRDDQDALKTSTPTRVYNNKLRELADYLGVSRPYMPRKVKSGSWDARDLDKLALYFRMYPQDFVPGPHDDWGPADGAVQADASTDVTPEGHNLGDALPGQ